MGKRPKSSKDRQRDLEGTLKELDLALERYEDEQSMYPLRTVACHLVALAVRTKYGNRYPLLLDLAAKRDFSLEVHVLDPKVREQLVKQGAGHNQGGYDLLSLEAESFVGSQTVKMPLEEALSEISIVVGSEEISLREAILDVRDTEAAHHDRKRPQRMDSLDFTRNLHSIYHVVYRVAKVVSALSHQFIKQIAG